MFYVKAKMGNRKMRDGTTGEMKVVTPREWVLFDSFPRGIDPLVSHCDIEIKVADREHVIDDVDAQNKAMSEEDEAEKKSRKAKRK